MTREEAINEVRTWAIPSEKGREVLETLIPELKESEDERIRMALVEYFAPPVPFATVRSIPVQKVRDWLEKQKEQSITANDLDEEIHRFFDDCIEVHDAKIYGVDERVITVDCYEITARHFAKWGEKQKEQSLRDFIDDFPYSDEQKEHKPQTSEEKEYIRTIKSIISDFIRDKKPEDLAYYQRIYDWLDGRHVPFSCGHENGQPVDPVFSKQEYESYPIISKDTTSTKPVEFDGKTLLYTADKSYQIGFRDGVASVKPAEWSEEYREEDLRTRFAFYTYKDEDETLYLSNLFVEEASRNKGFGTKILQAAEKVAETIGATTICLKVKQDSPANAWYRKHGYGYVTFEDGYDWLKKNLEYLKPAKSAEWSEEDEKDVAHIIRVLDDCYAYGKHDLSKTDHENLVGTLKSLRLQPKLEWSDGNKQWFDAIIKDYEDSLSGDEDHDPAIQIKINLLKSLYLQSHWKPSEQEKGALRTAIYVLTEERNFPKAAVQLQNILDAFEGKESRKDWKPSEEQMESLRRAVDKLAKIDVVASVSLSIMYDNLKKLM